MTQPADPTPAAAQPAPAAAQPAPLAVTRPVTVAAVPVYRRPIFWVALAVFIAIIWFTTRPRENRYEQEATRVTQAIVNNDVRPIESDFTLRAQSQMQNRGRVGRLSDDLNALGKFEGIKEDTPPTAVAGYHHFIATFQQAKWFVAMTYDTQGKISAFHITANDSYASDSAE